MLAMMVLYINYNTISGVKPLLRPPATRLPRVEMLVESALFSSWSLMKQPLNVAITGAAGQIGYALAFRVASGAMLGADQPINLHLLEITPALPTLGGVVMELTTARFPRSTRSSPATMPRWPFAIAMSRCWSGARPRGPGMERKDLLLANAQIFSAQGKALE